LYDTKIKDYIPNEKIMFNKHKHTNDLQIIFTDKKSMMTVLKENTWDEIKRHIDSKLCNKLSNECSICFTSEQLLKRRVSCPKCAMDWCIDCYIQIFRKNEGVIKCPFCRYTYGHKFPKHMIEIGVQQILGSL
jgi:hypothetical protein